MDERAVMKMPLIALALLAAAPASADPVTLSLTEAEKEALIAGNTRRDLADPTATPRQTDRRPHGEVGVMVGTGGARSLHGSAAVPLGSSGWAAFGFEDSRNIWPVPF